MQGDKQSAWKCVKGWTKDRNLEDSLMEFILYGVTPELFGFSRMFDKDEKLCWLQ